MDYLDALRRENSSRLREWEDGNPADAEFHAIELGGEVGELLNVMKKLKRAQMGWRGSVATRRNLEDEIADVLICLDKLAAYYAIDLAEVTSRKFNATSEEQGFTQRL